MKRIIINNSIKERTIVREIWIVYNKNEDEKTIYIRQQRSLPNFYKPISNLSKFISFDSTSLLKGINVISFDTLPNITVNSIIYTDINKIDFDICDLLVSAKNFSSTLALTLSTSHRLMSFSEPPNFINTSLKQCEEIDWIIDKLKLKKS